MPASSIASMKHLARGALHAVVMECAMQMQVRAEQRKSAADFSIAKELKGSIINMWPRENDKIALLHQVHYSHRTNIRPRCTCTSHTRRQENGINFQTINVPHEGATH